jgi:hypothetical protein
MKIITGKTNLYKLIVVKDKPKKEGEAKENEENELSKI